MVGSLLEVLGIGTIPAFLGAAISPDSFEKVPLIGPPLAGIGRSNPISLLRIGSIAIVIAFLLKNCFHLLEKYMIARYCKGRQTSLGFRLFRAYQNAPMESLFERNNAIVIRTLNSDIQMICNNVLMALAEILIATVSSIAILGLITMVEWKVAIPLFLLAGSVGMLYAVILNPFSRMVGQRSMSARTDMVRELTESLGSIRETRVMGLEEFQGVRIQAAMKTTAQAQVSQFVSGSLATPLLEMMAIVGILGTISFLVSNPEDLVGLVPTLALLVLSLVRLRSYVAKLFGLWNAICFRVPSIRCVVDDIQTFEAEAAARAPKNPQPFRFEDAIVLKDVCYRYPSSDVMTVSNVNVRIDKGEVLAVTGKTGSGKTTLVDLMLGVLRPQSGSVTIDGVPVHEIKSLRAHVGYVPQFIHLYDDTLRNNIALGIKASKIQDGQVWKALELAQIADFVREQPDKLDMQIGENGVRLSGGQRQRLGVARALYGSPDILVLDEGTSALDTETETELMNSVFKLSHRVTVILIAHRLGTLKKATHVIEVESGFISDDRLVQCQPHHV